MFTLLTAFDMYAQCGHLSILFLSDRIFRLPVLCNSVSICFNHLKMIKKRFKMIKKNFALIAKDAEKIAIKSMNALDAKLYQYSL